MKKSKLLLIGLMAISFLVACQPDPTSSPNATTSSSKDETSEHSESTSSSQSETTSSSINGGTITFPWV